MTLEKRALSINVDEKNDVCNMTTAEEIDVTTETKWDLSIIDSEETNKHQLVATGSSINDVIMRFKIEKKEKNPALF